MIQRNIEIEEQIDKHETRKATGEDEMSSEGVEKTQGEDRSK